MINAAIVGLGWWGRTLVESVQGTSQHVQFVAGSSRSASPELKAFAAKASSTVQAHLTHALEVQREVGKTATH